MLNGRVLAEWPAQPDQWEGLLESWRSGEADKRIGWPGSITEEEPVFK